jgi:hypothetical protein
MKQIKQYDLVVVLQDKLFKYKNSEAIVKKGTLGYVVDIIILDNLPTGYDVELIDTEFHSPVFTFREDEIDLCKEK